MLVLIEVCCSDRPIASATLMNRFAKRVSRIGSGPLLVLLCATCGSDIVNGAWISKIFFIDEIYDSVRFPEWSPAMQILPDPLNVYQ